MFVGVMEIGLALYDNESLKDKRSVVRRVVHRTKNSFNVAAAEVDDLDAADRATLGFVAVGNDHAYVQGLLDKVENFIVRLALCDVLDAEKTVDVY